MKISVTWWHYYSYRKDSRWNKQRERERKLFLFKRHRQGKSHVKTQWDGGWLLQRRAQNETHLADSLMLTPPLELWEISASSSHPIDGDILVMAAQTPQDSKLKATIQWKSLKSSTCILSGIESPAHVWRRVQHAGGRWSIDDPAEMLWRSVRGLFGNACKNCKKF